MATQILAANNAQSVLAAGISSSATSLTVNTGTGALFPSPVSGTSFFKLTLIDAATGNLTEIMHVTARSGDVMTVDRAQEGTVARSWSANDIVANMMTAGTLAYIINSIQSLNTGTPAIGVPFFWSSAAMPNTVLPEWSGMVFLKFNGATFSAATYPKLALVFPALLLPEARGEFLRVWDDGRGVDAGRALLSAQLDALQNITGAITVGDNNSVVGAIGAPTGAFTGVNDTGKVPVWTSGSVAGTRYAAANFNAANVARTAAETRSRNIAFNLLVRAK